MHFIYPDTCCKQVCDKLQCQSIVPVMENTETEAITIPPVWENSTEGGNWFNSTEYYEGNSTEWDQEGNSTEYYEGNSTNGENWFNSTEWDQGGNSTNGENWFNSTEWEDYANETWINGTNNYENVTEWDDTSLPPTPSPTPIPIISCNLQPTHSLGQVICPPGFTTEYYHPVNSAAKCSTESKLCDRCIGLGEGIEVIAPPGYSAWPAGGISAYGNAGVIGAIVTNPIVDISACNPACNPQITHSLDSVNWLCPEGYSTNFNYGVSGAARCDTNSQRCNRCIGSHKPGTIPGYSKWPRSVDIYSSTYVTDVVPLTQACGGQIDRELCCLSDFDLWEQWKIGWSELLAENETDYQRFLEASNSTGENFFDWIRDYIGNMVDEDVTDDLNDLEDLLLLLSEAHLDNTTVAGQEDYLETAALIAERLDPVWNALEATCWPQANLSEWELQPVCREVCPKCTGDDGGPCGSECLQTVYEPLYHMELTSTGINDADELTTKSVQYNPWAQWIYLVKIGEEHSLVLDDFNYLSDQREIFSYVSPFNDKANAISRLKIRGPNTFPYLPNGTISDCYFMTTTDVSLGNKYITQEPPWPIVFDQNLESFWEHYNKWRIISTFFGVSVMILLTISFSLGLVYNAQRRHWIGRTMSKFRDYRARNKVEACAICYSRPSSVTFKPCGHNLACGGCAKHFQDKTCPYCREKITKFEYGVYSSEHFFPKDGKNQNDIPLQNLK